MTKKYGALRTIGTVYKVIGVIAGLITVLTVIGLCGMSVLGGAAVDSFANEFGTESGFGIFSSLLGGILAGLGAFIYGGGLSITLYAMGEGVYLLIDLEENTRETTELLRRGK